MPSPIRPKSQKKKAHQSKDAGRISNDRIWVYGQRYEPLRRSACALKHESQITTTSPALIFLKREIAEAWCHDEKDDGNFNPGLRARVMRMVSTYEGGPLTDHRPDGSRPLAWPHQQPRSS
jgi:hypothetical protein